MMRSKRMRIGGMFSLVAAIAMLGACEQGPTAMDAQEPTVSLSASDTNILVGETTTVMAQTANLLGRDVEIDWSTSVGEIEPTEEGRMARFTSDQAGTAVVTAELQSDGRVIRDQINIVVNPID
ncbi:hypothetical protein ACERK3_03395 [Phycisphaerales bacterium AB-hyl4]|uniref:BIG2 domain-containing protein n=1 Tax=Natronomicrosphaera hydrolytica TaxID=3242702 RepID=A0ABV4U1B7_9BACT